MLTFIPQWVILISDKKEIGSELRYSRDLCSRKQEEFSSFTSSRQIHNLRSSICRSQGGHSMMNYISYNGLGPECSLLSLAP